MTLREIFTVHGLAAHVEAFEREHVRVEDLGELTDDDLRAHFGLVGFMDRKRFRAMVAAIAGGAVPAPSLSDGVTRIDTAVAGGDGVTRMGDPLVAARGEGVTGGGSPAPLPSQEPGATRIDGPVALPQKLGNYHVLGLVGAGGMGTVLRARHAVEAWAEKQGGDVAIKLIHPNLAADPAFQRRFIDEAGLGRSVSHPGLVPVYDLVAEGPWLGTVMGFVDGEALSSRVRTGGLPLDEVVGLLGRVGEVLDHLHAKGIVHRDVKPANIAVRDDGRPIVLDLGIAKDTRVGGENRTRAMTAMGTSAWMAPEQADARSVDGAADRYAFGLMAYALLSGRMPWDADTPELAIIVKKAMGQLVPLQSVRGDLPAFVAAAVTKMLSVSPPERYPSCAAFMEALTRDAEPEAREAAAREAGVTAEREAREKAEREAREKAEREAAERAQALEDLERSARGELERLEQTGPAVDVATVPPTPFARPEHKARQAVSVGAEPRELCTLTLPPEVARERARKIARVARNLGLGAISEEKILRLAEFSADAGDVVELPLPCDREQLRELKQRAALPDSAHIRMYGGPHAFRERQVDRERKAQMARRAQQTVAVGPAPTAQRGSGGPSPAGAAVTRPQAAPQKPTRSGNPADTVSDGNLPWAKPAHAASTERPAYEVRRKVGGFFGLGAREVHASFSMAVVPPCRFMMGRPVDPAVRAPSHYDAQFEARLTRAYAIALTPVTQALYEAVTGSNPARFKDGPRAPLRPVEMVSWYDAVRFCNALSTQVGLTPAYEIGTGPKPTLHLIEGTDGFRLPTEAEWECAAGAGAGTRFAGGNELDAAGWFNGNSDRTTQPVGLKPANAWGLFDMSGNVSEFTGDGSGNYPVGVVVNPRGDGTSTSPVVRGGDYRSAERACEVAQRNSCSPDSVLPSYGFRLARSVTL